MILSMSSTEGVHPPKRSHTTTLVEELLPSFREREYALQCLTESRISATGNSSFGVGFEISLHSACFLDGCTRYESAASFGESRRMTARMSLMTSVKY